MDGAPAKQRRATLATVAASAGVSVATVSKVLNGRSDVAAATRALVQEMLQRHDYAASAPQRSEAAAHPTVEVEVDGELRAYSVRDRPGGGRRRRPDGRRRRHQLPRRPRRQPAGRAANGLGPRARGSRPAGSHRRHERADGRAPHGTEAGKGAARRRRPDERAARRRHQRRVDELRRRPDGDAAPAGVGPPPDRLRRRPDERDVQPRPAAWLPGRDGGGRRTGAAGVRDDRTASTTRTD